MFLVWSKFYVFFYGDTNLTVISGGLTLCVLYVIKISLNGIMLLVVFYK